MSENITLASENWMGKLNVTWDRKRIAPAIIIFLLSAYLVLVPSIHFFPGVGYYNEKRILEIVVLLSCALYLLFSNDGLKKWLEIFLSIPLLARVGLFFILVMGILSSSLAPYPKYAFLEVAHYVLLFILAIFIAAFYRYNPKFFIYWLSGVVTLCVFFYGVKFLSGYIMNFFKEGNYLWPHDDDVITSVYFSNFAQPFKILGFAYIRYFNQLQTWTLPLLALPYLLINDGNYKKGIWVLASFWWMLVLASGGRGTPLAVVLSLITCYILFRNKVKRIVKFQFYSITGGGALYILFYHILNNGNGGIFDRVSEIGMKNGRLNIWGDGWQLLKNNLFTGIGPMHFADYNIHLNSLAHPHNALVQFGVEWGIPVAIILSTIILWGGISAIKKYSTDNQKIYGLTSTAKGVIIISLFSGLLHSMVSGLIVMPVSQIMLVIIVGAAIGLFINNEKNDSSIPTHQYISRILFLVTLVTLIYGIRVDAVDLLNRKDTYIQTTGSMQFSPRYWQEGFFDFNDTY